MHLVHLKKRVIGLPLSKCMLHHKAPLYISENLLPLKCALSVLSKLCDNYQQRLCFNSKI